MADLSMYPAEYRPLMAEADAILMGGVQGWTIDYTMARLRHCGLNGEAIRRKLLDMLEPPRAA